MAITIQPLTLDAAEKIISDADVDETAEVDVNHGAAKIVALVLDNTANSATTYLKLYNTATVTVGTTVPDLVLMVLASVTRTMVIKSRSYAGLYFDTALTLAAVTAGGTAGTTGPTSAALLDVVLG